MAATYLSTASGVAPGASVTKGIFELVTGSTREARIVSIDLSMDGGASSFWPTINLIIGSGSVTAATGGTSVTPAGQNGDGNTVTAIATTKKGTFSAELAAGSGTLTTVSSWYLPNSSGLFYQWPLGRELYIPKSCTLYIQASTPASFANNFAINLAWEE